MAKRNVNKSEAIRALYRGNPKLPVKIAVEQLAKDGIKVAPSQVYFVLGGMKGKAKRKAGRKPRAVVPLRPASKIGLSVPLDVLIDLKALAARAGGVAALKQLLEVLE
jgi:hypothetical protein